MDYLFDTDTLNFFYKKSLPQHEAILKNILNLNDADSLKTTVLNICELEYSLKLAPQNKQTEIKTLLQKVKHQFCVCSLTLKTASVYGELKASLKITKNVNSKQMKKHNIDILIASIGLAENAIVVSSDSIYRDIAKIRPDFRYENWLVE